MCHTRLTELWVSIEQALTSEELRIFKMRHRYDMRQIDIARILGIPRAAVSQRLARIRRKLR
jgi:RNA polymerase sigma factor (sigma-70 family)